MYNRYIPQPDGSYRRSRISEPPQSPPPIPAPPPELPQQNPPPKPPQQSAPGHRPVHPSPGNGNAGDFLRQLLPKNLDTGDLLIIVLLLLMSADCREDRNIALLTLALYLIM